MKRVAVFGNAGGGKSTLARRLADLTRLPLHTVDMIKFKAGGEAVPHDEYLKIHADLIHRDEWIIDGFGCVASACERFSAADTLIYVDLPLSIHYRWVTKRLIKGFFASPKGWPENSPLWSSMQPQQLSRHPALPPLPHSQIPAARRRRSGIKAGSPLRSPAEIQVFLAEIEKEHLWP